MKTAVIVLRVKVLLFGHFEKAQMLCVFVVIGPHGPIVISRMVARKGDGRRRFCLWRALAVKNLFRLFECVAGIAQKTASDFKQAVRVLVAALLLRLRCPGGGVIGEGGFQLPE